MIQIELVLALLGRIHLVNHNICRNVGNERVQILNAIAYIRNRNSKTIKMLKYFRSNNVPLRKTETKLQFPLTET